MKNPRRPLIIGAIIVAVVLVGTTGYLLWQIKASEPSSQSQQTKKPVPQYDNKQKLAEEVNEKYATKDYADAIDMIEQQKDSATDPQLQLLLAGAYANSSNFAKALEIYKKLDESGKLPKTSLENMASIASSAKEYRLAIDMYKRAKEYALSQPQRNDDQIATYNYLIAELEKKL